MIPKIIHYCWLSNDPLPKEVHGYIEGWKQVLPDYEFIKWGFDRFDINQSQWVREAFEARKYAFAADYIRLYALYHFGGIYLDSDVEVLRTFDPLLGLRTMMCYEDFGDRYEMATFGVEKESAWVKQALAYYDNRPFVREDGSCDMKVVPKIVVEVFEQQGIEIRNVNSLEQAMEAEKADYIPVFSSDYFSPKSYATGKVTTTAQTFSIHHFAGSWLPDYVKWEHAFWNFLGLNDPNILMRVVKMKKKLKALLTR